MVTCTKCDGKGKIARFSHFNGGKCYNCNGTGKVEGEAVNSAGEVEHLQLTYHAAREEYRRLLGILKETPKGSQAYRTLSAALEALTVKGKAVAARLNRNVKDSQARPGKVLESAPIVEGDLTGSNALKRDATQLSLF